VARQLLFPFAKRQVVSRFPSILPLNWTKPQPQCLRLRAPGRTQGVFRAQTLTSDIALLCGGRNDNGTRLSACRAILSVRPYPQIGSSLLGLRMR
jgi:hypothetical protein